MSRLAVKQPVIVVAATVMIIAACAVLVMLRAEAPSDRTSGGVTSAGKPNGSSADDSAFSVIGDGQTELNGIGVGDLVSLGTISFKSYWGAQVSEDFQWRVLAFKDGKALLITRDIVEMRPYKLQNAQAAWADSDIRKWLNSDFYAGLPSEVQRNVAGSYLSSAGAGAVGSGSGAEDKVFLLSVDEANNLFTSYNDRQAVTNVSDATRSAVEEAYKLDPGYIKSTEQEEGGWSWWLRTSDISKGTAAVVSADGNASEIGGVHAQGPMQVPDYAGVRPVLWVDCGILKK